MVSLADAAAFALRCWSLHLTVGPIEESTKVPNQGTVIASWLVRDSAEEATHFPQIGMLSASAEAQDIYWRCLLCLFASSLPRNKRARHVVVVNQLPMSAIGRDVLAILQRWGVEALVVPVAHRLPIGSVSSFGNQFYVLDALRALTEHCPDHRIVLLDSDCVFISGVEVIERLIDEFDALAYTLGNDEYGPAGTINGLSRNDLARFARDAMGLQVETVDYNGGEILAASASASETIVRSGEDVWRAMAVYPRHAPKEDAHLLSVVYAIEQFKPATASSFIRRIWTTFQHYNAKRNGFALVLWHLPSEKRTGLERWADSMLEQKNDFLLGAGPRLISPTQLGLMLGVPHRSVPKAFLDVRATIVEKFKSRLGVSELVGKRG